MFIGTYDHSIDEKSRITLPRRFRDALGAGVVLARGLDRNVAVYPRLKVPSGVVVPRDSDVTWPADVLRYLA